MIWWCIAALCAFFIKGLCGFANTLVFSTVLSFANNNVSISPVELLLGYPTNLIMVWRERKSVDWKVCLPLAALVLIGNIPGAIFLKNADTGVIKIFFGIVIVLIGLEMLIREYHPKKAKESKLVLAFIGIISGVLCGLYGIGALLGAYVSRVTDNSHAFKANICVVFVVENTFRIIMYSMLGILNWEILKQALVLSPVMLAGLFLGIKSSNVLNETFVKKLVIVMLVISGMALVMNNAR